MSALYQKSLVLSPDSRREYSTGEITNFVSVDSQQIVDVVGYISHSWADPLTVYCTVQ